MLLLDSLYINNSGGKILSGSDDAKNSGDRPRASRIIRPARCAASLSSGNCSLFLASAD